MSCGTDPVHKRKKPGAFFTDQFYVSYVPVNYKVLANALIFNADSTIYLCFFFVFFAFLLVMYPHLDTFTCRMVCWRRREEMKWFETYCYQWIMFHEDCSTERILIFIPGFIQLFL